MLTLGIETIVILLVIVGVVSAFGGYVVAQERQRRAGGGKSAAELKTELGDYQDSVTEHFQTTAGLLQDMTEQYRAVYEHMASGAQNLCDQETAQSQIESLRAGLLPSSPGPGDDELADTVVAETHPVGIDESDESAAETLAESGDSPTGSAPIGPGNSETEELSDSDESGEHGESEPAVSEAPTDEPAERIASHAATDGESRADSEPSSTTEPGETGEEARPASAA